MLELWPAHMPGIDTGWFGAESNYDYYRPPEGCEGFELSRWGTLECATHTGRRQKTGFRGPLPMVLEVLTSELAAVLPPVV